MDDEVAEVSGYWANLNHPVRRGRGQRRGDPPVPQRRPRLDRRQPVAETGNLHQGAHSWVERRVGRGRDRPGRDLHRRDVGDLGAAAQRPLDDPRRGRPARRGSRPKTAPAFTRSTPSSHYHALQIQDFLRAIIEDRPPLVTGDDGRRVVALFQAIYRVQPRGKVDQTGDRMIGRDSQC